MVSRTGEISSIDTYAGLDTPAHDQVHTIA